MIKLYTERLIIRDPIEDDLAATYELLSDEKAMKYWQSSKTKNMGEIKEKLLKSINEAKSSERKLYYFKIIDKNTKEYIGEIGYTVTLRTPFGKFVDLGYAIKEKYWGMGYTTEAVKRIIEFAFEEDNVYRITAGCLKENIGSEKIMQKCKFIKEAEFKEYTYHEGKLKDRVEYRLLKNEWKK